ncbi:helix-turn-helix domain-containing protein [bacterium]|nr:helix-turn-helix domain-containing protein [bacterium]
MKNLVQVLVDIDNVKKMEGFLNTILTGHERDSIPRRLEIVRLLKKGVSQHDIAKKLGVGVATVTRGSKELQNSNWWRDYSSSTHPSF